MEIKMAIPLQDGHFLYTELLRFQGVPSVMLSLLSLPLL